MIWGVDFVLDERGRSPVEEFLSSLLLQHRAKALALIKMLELEGPNLPFPYSSQLRGKLRELKRSRGKTNYEYSILEIPGECFPLARDCKKNSQVPEQEIRIAELRMELHNARIARRPK